MTQDTRARDTQWPRWEVFKQDTPNKTHGAVGSVHAGDAEHALLTARNVFARRPAAVSMWVVPAERILSVTAEELAKGLEGLEADDEGTPQTFLVFTKTSHKQSLTFVDYVGEVEAGSARVALKHALERFNDPPALAWWLVPESAVVKSREEDVESWFEPAKEKTYKQQSEYGMTRTKKHRKARERAS